MNLTEKILLLKYTHQKLNDFEYLEILSNNFKKFIFYCNNTVLQECNCLF